MQSVVKLHRYPESIRTACASREGRGNRRGLGNSCHQTNAFLEKFNSNAFAWQFESGTTFAVSFLCGDILNFSISHISALLAHFLPSLSLTDADDFEYLLFLANTGLWSVTSFLGEQYPTSFADEFAQNLYTLE